MGDEQQGHVPVAHQRTHELQDLRLDRDVQGRGRLIGDEQLGLTGKRHGDHDALPHAARELVRVALHHAGRVGQADRGEELDDARAGIRPGEAEVEAQRLGDLLAGPVERVQGGERVLEDHGHPLAAHPSVLRLGQPHELVALEADAALDGARARRQEPHDGAAAHGLAGARLTHQADDLAGPDGEIEPVDGVDGAGDGAEADGQARTSSRLPAGPVHRRGHPARCPSPRPHPVRPRRARSKHAAAPSSLALPRVELDPQPVTDEVEADDRDHDGQAGRDGRQRVLEQV